MGSSLLTALETKECPPHYWYIDSVGMGKCLKCGEKRSFVLRINSRDELYREKSANGGRVSQSKKRRMKS